MGLSNTSFFFISLNTGECLEVASTYEKALEQEEERVTYQRKMLLLSVKNVRERENEILTRAKSSLQKKHVENTENELESMLRTISKQVTLTSFSSHQTSYKRRS